MFNKNLKTKRGFSLVELMVVVAIMGTLAAIAIPAYNEYRKTAKKGAYRADLTQLHKAWLTFGVELDNYCQRETGNANASIGLIMPSITSSKFYGDNAVVQASCTRTGGATTGGTLLPANCGNTNDGQSCTGCSPASGGSGTPGVTYTAYSAGNGPGKANFIGFGANSCSLAATSIVAQDSTSTDDNDCNLNAGDYRMGVFGHVAGADYHGAEMTNNGIITERVALTDVAFVNTCI